MTNNISIDGHVDGWFSDDTAARFEAYGWQVIRNVDVAMQNKLRCKPFLLKAEKKTNINYL